MLIYVNWFRNESRMFDLIYVNTCYNLVKRYGHGHLWFAEG
jgi:hypothetical protein